MERRWHHFSLSFIESLHVRGHTTSWRRHRVAFCNINRTSDPSREDEIAAKIANLRKQKRLKSQGLSPNNIDLKKAEEGGPTNSHDASSKISFEDLPDWKKKQVLENQIADAERFFYRDDNDPEYSPQSSAKYPEEPGDYQPKVSTWGVFPRPDNISKKFGGGRRIKIGGVELNNSESRRRDEDVKKRLAAYRASRGIDMEKEEAHQEQIETALCDAEKLMKQTRPYDAVEELESVADLTSDRSRLGGSVHLSLALAYEAIGRRQDAREIYVRLRKNPFSDISGKAKQLLQGFAAMEHLQVDDETQMKGYRVTQFALPDVAYASDRKYETVILDNNGKTNKSEKLSTGTSLGLFAVMASPALLVLLLILWRR